MAVWMVEDESRGGWPETALLAYWRWKPAERRVRQMKERVSGALWFLASREKEGDEQRLVSVGERVWCLEKLELGSGSALLAESERKSGKDQLWVFKENEGWSARVWLQPRGGKIGRRLCFFRQAGGRSLFSTGRKWAAPGLRGGLCFGLFGGEGRQRPEERRSFSRSRLKNKTRGGCVFGFGWERSGSKMALVWFQPAGLIGWERGRNQIRPAGVWKNENHHPGGRVQRRKISLVGSGGWV